MKPRFLHLVFGLTALAAYSRSWAVGVPVSGPGGRPALPKGAPAGVDSGPTHHSGRIDTNEVWYPSGNPHILDNDVCTGNNVTLTIMPGCVVKAEYGVELYTGYVYPGTIIAAGTADSLITFTSNITNPQPGDWRGIGIYSLARNATRFSYCDFAYAGGSTDYGTFYVHGVAPSFDHCLISQSGDHGVFADYGGRFSSFTSNTITTCADYPVDIEADRVYALGPGNVLTGNSRDGILVNGGNISITGTWLNHGVPYVIDGDVSISDATNSPVLTIAPGTRLMLTTWSEFYVGYAAPGGLIADGTAGRIEFTSAVNPPSPGDWEGVGFYDGSISSQCRLINCNIEYGGDGDYGNIYISNCTPEIVGDSIGHSSAWGIWLGGTEYPDPQLLRANNTFYDCASGDVRVPNGGIAEKPLNPWSRRGPGDAMEPATIIRGVLVIPQSALRSPQYRVELFDANGRQVMKLKPGENDVSRVAPGVYFVHEAQGRAVRKVVVTE